MLGLREPERKGHKRMRGFWTLCRSSQVSCRIGAVHKGGCGASATGHRGRLQGLGIPDSTKPVVFAQFIIRRLDKLMKILCLAQVSSQVLESVQKSHTLFPAASLVSSLWLASPEGVLWAGKLSHYFSGHMKLQPCI